MSNEKNELLGKDIISLCGKCKLALGHTVMTVNKSGVADKCQCNTCKAVHKYKDPDKPKKTKKTSSKAPKKESVPIETLWNEAMSGAKGASKDYVMASEFGKGDLIAHSTFGKGVVQELISPNKIKVIFMSAEKTLIHKYQQV